MKLKEALVKDGFLKPEQLGRGRPSKAMIDRAKELVEQGWVIDGFSKSNTTIESEVKPEVKHTPAKGGGKEIADIGDPFRDEDTLTAWGTNAEGKPVKVGIKTVCNLCGNSLTYCPHPTPVVNLDYNLTSEVVFKRKVNA